MAVNFDEYATFDGLGLATLVKRREVTPAELAAVALKAIEATNPALNAVLQTYDESVDRIALGAGNSSAPFLGVPFLLKDIGSHDAAVRMELGSRLMRGLTSPPFASELITRFRAAGVNIIGRTNIPELGSSCTTEPLLHGPTLNPWNRERTPGGSSGGAAAAIAAGMVPIAHANDAGGSIRWPASCCGLFGLKPSRNLNPVGPGQALLVNGLVAEHILSRSVRDSAAMLDATAGPDPGAWCYTPRFAGSYLAETFKPPGKLRIGLNLTPNFPPTTLDASIVEATRQVAAVCVSLGHEVEEVRLDFDPEPALRCNFAMWTTGLRQFILELAKVSGRAPSDETLEPHIMAAFRAGAEIAATELQWALEHLNAVARSYGRLFEHCDVMLTPTGAMEPFVIGRIASLNASNFFDWYMAMMSHCPFLSSVNMAGVPAMSVPLTQMPSGLPVGTHFVAAMGNEPLLFRLAAQLEGAQPWFHRRPPVHVAASPSA